MWHTPFPHISQFNSESFHFSHPDAHISHMSHTPFPHISEFDSFCRTRRVTLPLLDTPDYSFIDESKVFAVSPEPLPSLTHPRSRTRAHSLALIHPPSLTLPSLTRPHSLYPHSLTTPPSLPRPPTHIRPHSSAQPSSYRCGIFLNSISDIWQKWGCDIQEETEKRFFVSRRRSSLADLPPSGSLAPRGSRCAPFSP